MANSWVNNDIILTTDNLNYVQQMLAELSDGTKTVGLNINLQKNKFLANLVVSNNMNISGEEAE